MDVLPCLGAIQYALFVNKIHFGVGYLQRAWIDLKIKWYVSVLKDFKGRTTNLTVQTNSNDDMTIQTKTHHKDTHTHTDPSHLTTSIIHYSKPLEISCSNFSLVNENEYTQDWSYIIHFKRQKTRLESFPNFISSSSIIIITHQDHCTASTSFGGIMLNQDMYMYQIAEGTYPFGIL